MSNFAQAQAENTAESQKKQVEFKNIHTERPKFCIHCGAPLGEDNDFCTECGEKIESEVSVEEDISEKSAQPVEKRPAPKIGSDRMASIMETKRVKEGGLSDELKKSWNEFKRENQQISVKAHEKSVLKTGYYINTNSERTKYLIIENITGSSVSATIKTTFKNGSYKTEHYDGYLLGDNLSLSVSETDLHPLPDEFVRTEDGTATLTHSIKVGNHFSGTVSEDKIAGNFSGEFSEFVVFTKE